MEITPDFRCSSRSLVGFWRQLGVDVAWALRASVVEKPWPQAAASRVRARR